VSCLYDKHIYFEQIWAQDKIYILTGTLLGLNMNLALFCNLNFIKVYINYESMLFISLALCQIYLLEFIQLEGGMKIMKHFKGAAPATKVCEPLVRVYSKLICQSVVHKNNYKAKVKYFKYPKLAKLHVKIFPI
jgi:hypothetical protein